MSTKSSSGRHQFSVDFYYLVLASQFLTKVSGVFCFAFRVLLQMRFIHARASIFLKDTWSTLRFLQRKFIRQSTQLCKCNFSSTGLFAGACSVDTFFCNYKAYPKNHSEVIYMVNYPINASGEPILFTTNWTEPNRRCISARSFVKSNEVCSSSKQFRKSPSGQGAPFRKEKIVGTVQAHCLESPAPETYARFQTFSLLFITRRP